MRPVDRRAHFLSNPCRSAWSARLTGRWPGPDGVADYGARGSNASPGLDVELIASGHEEVAQRGPVGSVHEAELLVEPEAVERLLAADFLKQVAVAYWRFLG